MISFKNNFNHACIQVRTAMVKTFFTISITTIIPFRLQLGVSVTSTTDRVPYSGSQLLLIAKVNVSLSSRVANSEGDDRSRASIDSQDKKVHAIDDHLKF